MEIEITVTETKNIQRNFEHIAQRLASGDLLARTGLKIERQAKMNATGRPGPNVQTGRLRASITVQLSPELPVTEAVVGTNVTYAPFVELGHAQEVGRFVPAFALGRRGGGLVVTKGLGFRLVNPRAPAYPFLRPALEQVQQSGGMNGVFGEFATDIERDWMR